MVSCESSGPPAGGNAVLRGGAANAASAARFAGIARAGPPQTMPATATRRANDVCRRGSRGIRAHDKNRIEQERARCLLAE
jgi:hypothetical protein